jgi:protein-L-isoaspartate(D-aspartate) O-methyltransferase
MGPKDALIRRWKRESLVSDTRIYDAFREIDREDFIRREDLEDAYGDYPLPIGSGQTISQPTTIMIMIDALGVKPEDNVLEIGAGSGYNAALLSILSRKVTTTEIIPALAKNAENNLKNAGIKNAEVISSDGSIGYGKNAPYDKVIMTAASPAIPPPLVEQLKEGGRIIAPVGELSSGQSMLIGEKKDGEMQYRSIGYFSFVPLKGKHGYR